jgi:hypothetical protein
VRPGERSPAAGRGGATGAPPRASTREGEDAFVRRHGAAECAANVSEELALHEAFRDRRGVEGDEWAGAAGLAVVDRARDQLLY